MQDHHTRRRTWRQRAHDAETSDCMLMACWLTVVLCALASACGGPA